LPCQKHGEWKFPLRRSEYGQQAAEHCINPSEEVIELGQLRVHFLVSGENSSGSIAAFELVVAGGARLMAPDHSHDHYEETIYGVDVHIVFSSELNRMPVETMVL
jgi:hypothetical protein